MASGGVARLSFSGGKVQGPREGGREGGRDGGTEGVERYRCNGDREASIPSPPSSSSIKGMILNFTDATVYAYKSYQTVYASNPNPNVPLS